MIRITTSFPSIFHITLKQRADNFVIMFFESVSEIEGFDRDGRVTIVDQENSIDTSYCHNMTHDDMFLDMLHVKKNLIPHLVKEKASALRHYENAVFAPATHITDSIKEKYSDNQATYLGKLSDKILYRSYSKPRDLITTSQGAESQIASSLRNNIHSVTPGR